MAIHIIFYLAYSFLFLSTPFFLLAIVLYFFRRRLSLTYRLGFYKISNIIFVYENRHDIRIELKIEKIQIKLIWFRLRLVVEGFECVVEYCPSKDILSNNKEKQFDNFDKNKQKFFNYLKTYFIFTDGVSKSNTIESKIYYVDDMIKNKKNKLSFLEKILRFILCLFDIEMRRVNLIFKLTDINFYHSIGLGRVLAGLARDKTKVNLIIILE